MKIVDAFIFYNELKMLEFRLFELGDIVDHFVIVESTHTFTGKEKPLYFNENREKFSKYLHKIVHIIVDDMPNNGNAWNNEHYQRRCIKKGLDKLSLDDNDIVMVTDCDEIPNVKAIQYYRDSNLSNICSLGMPLYYYNLNCRCVNYTWTLPKISRYGDCKNYSIEHFRHVNTDTILERGGWHFSYFGDSKFIINKIQNFSHQEYNSSTYTNEWQIEELIKNCKDLFFRDGYGATFEYVDIQNNDFLPTNYKMLL